MTIEETIAAIGKIKELQKQYGYADTQKRIEDGSIWKFEGAMGRHVMECLESGACFLSEDITYDYYNNTIPSRRMLEAGTKGTLENSQDFWQKVEDGEIELDEPSEDED